jgi:hypothetical protein
MAAGPGDGCGLLHQVEILIVAEGLTQQWGVVGPFLCTISRPKGKEVTNETLWSSSVFTDKRFGVRSGKTSIKAETNRSLVHLSHHRRHRKKPKLQTDA